jgi:iron complex transport system substrate-binding protein
MQLKVRNFIAVALLCAAAASCTNASTSADSLSDFNVEAYAPAYATGFSILGSDGGESVLITTHNPWQGADSIVTQLFVARGGESAPDGYDGPVLNGAAKRIVAMSSTHVAMLDALGEVGRVVGVSGKDYITNADIRRRADKIGDVGYDGNINYEVLASLSPDLVLLYGVNGASSMEGKLKELGIPFMYVGDYLEESPLGKAEWMVALAEVVGKHDAGVDAFGKIPVRYDAVKARAAKVSDKPKVMLNTPYSDSWFMPSTKSYIVQLISDAGGEYVYSQNTSTSSVPIDLEQAYLLTSKADKWLVMSNASSATEFRNTYPKFVDTKPVASGELYNNNKLVSANGANDYWESGVVHPDLVLRDMLKIMHPDLVSEDFVYYQHLK